MLKYFKKLTNKYSEKHINKSLNIDNNTKCLMIAPHADDEIIGCGGLLYTYAKNFDCICIGSSGVKYKDISAIERSNIRIKEFNEVMDILGIKNKWIFETYGEPPMIDQIKKLTNQYIKILNFKQYNYIFMPSPIDNHPEHKYITTCLIKNLLKKNGYNPNCQIVFYEVWTPLPYANYYFDISDIVDKKFAILSIYKSQLVYIDYIKRIKGLNIYRGVFKNNCNYAEAYQILEIKKYLQSKYTNIETF